MNTAAMLLALTGAGCVLSSAGAALLARRSPPQAWLGALVSFAVGALLGVALLEILPYILRAGEAVPAALAAMLAGILGFFVLEKLFVWRHHHGGQWVSEHDAHEVNAQVPGANLLLLGNSTHSLFDGFFIAAAYLAAPRLGVLTAVALFAHELAQQLGDAHHAPRGAGRLAPIIATLAGAGLGYLLLSASPHWVPAVLGGAAASMLYVAMADLIPSLHTRTDSTAAMLQVALIGVGAGASAVLGALL